MIERTLKQQILKNFKRNKIIILIGSRQVGKTTLAEMISNEFKNKFIWFNGDEPDVRSQLTDVTSTQLRTLIGKNELIIIDEAQRIKNIGLTLKLIYDNITKVKILATGSSSFELTSEINEPLTGRKREYFLYSLSYQEMLDQTNLLEVRRMLEHHLIYGYYPEVVTNPGEEKNILNEISQSYLYKDVLSYGNIKKPLALEKLVQAIALQLGQEVNYHELGQTVGVDNETIERWINLLEKSFVIFRLSSFSRNLRNEIKKGKKIYFYDNGIRNAIINNFNPLSLRTDIGALWENFLINERAKNNQNANRFVNKYFWRTNSQREIDYIEDYGGKLHAYEFKWNPNKKVKFPKSFLDNYPNSEIKVINRDNFEEFVLD